jgi:PucR C-terminal helix-turn-helix domain/GGDEF-like domain
MAELPLPGDLPNGRCLTVWEKPDTVPRVVVLTTKAGGGVSAADVAARRQVLCPLLERVDVLAEEGARAIRAELPTYGAQSEQFHADVLDQVRRNYTSVLTALMEGRALTADDVAYQRAAAMRRARAGIALEDYLRGYRVGHQVMWEAIVESAQAGRPGENVTVAFATELMRHVDYAATNAAQSYVEFRQYGLADADRERRDLLEHLLEGRLPEQGPLAAAGERYGLGTTTPALVAVAVSLGTVGDDAPTLASASLAHAGLQEATSLVVIRQSEIVGVMALGRDHDPDEVIVRVEYAQERLSASGTPMAIGVSTIAARVGDLPQAYREASAAVGFVGKEGGVAALTRLSPFEYMALTADTTARRMVDAGLVEFLRDDRSRGGVLVATVRAYAETDMRLKETAARLYVHPNTAKYRLNRIEELTGLDPRAFTDLHALLVAIALDDAGPTDP